MTFRIMDPKTEGNIYGDISEKNAVWNNVEKHEKPLSEMIIGETQMCTFRASGVKCEYRVIRLA